MRAPYISSLVFACLAAGCATTTPPELTASIASVEAAEKVGAAQVPKASQALQYAKHEVAWARALFVNGRDARARLMAERAENDAALAIALVHEHEARQSAERNPGAANP